MRSYITNKQTARKEDTMGGDSYPVDQQKAVAKEAVKVRRKGRKPDTTQTAAIYRSMDELPSVLGVTELQTFLGISRAGAYQLFHREDFPTLHIESRLLVTKDGLKRWMKLHTNGSNNGSDE